MMKLETVQLRSALRIFQRFLGKPLNYRNWIEDQGTHEHEHETVDGHVIAFGKFVKTHEICFHEIEYHGICFWHNPIKNKWCWSLAFYHPGNYHTPPDTDVVDQPEETDSLFALVQIIVKKLLAGRLDDALADEGMYIAHLESKKYWKEFQDLSDAEKRTYFHE